MQVAWRKFHGGVIGSAQFVGGQVGIKSNKLLTLKVHNMTYKKAVKYIVANWEKLKDTQKEIYSIPKTVAVWCAKSDIGEEYEVDEEWIGVTPQGDIAWAYASGCSCWEGDFYEERHESIKEFTLNHNHAPEDWEAAIIKFAETGIMQSL